MTIVGPGAGPGPSALVTRIKNILFEPQKEWDVIEAEPATVKGLYTGYICILAAIGPVARLIGSLVFPQPTLFGASWRPGVFGALLSAAVLYLLSLLGAYVFALVIDELAPSFGGQKNRLQALKVVAYSMTAAWLFQIFMLLPPMKALVVIGLFSFYLFYLGLPKLMKAPPEKAIAYTIVGLVTGAVIMSIAYTIALPLAGMG